MAVYEAVRFHAAACTFVPDGPAATRRSTWLKRDWLFQFRFARSRQVCSAGTGARRHQAFEGIKVTARPVKPSPNAPSPSEGLRFSHEGPCIRGEIARQAANLVAQELSGYAGACFRETILCPIGFCRLPSQRTSDGHADGGGPAGGSGGRQGAGDRHDLSGRCCLRSGNGSPGPEAGAPGPLATGPGRGIASLSTLETSTDQA